jgi:hypothetical protein
MGLIFWGIRVSDLDSVCLVVDASLALFTRWHVPLSTPTVRTTSLLTRLCISSTNLSSSAWPISTCPAWANSMLYYFCKFSKSRIFKIKEKGLLFFKNLLGVTQEVED